MSIAAILGPNGAIARQLSSYESRPQQLEMARAVAEALKSKRHLMVEAGTGVGKSFGYLVPALLANQDDKDFKIVVSTHTISLQEQLLNKDIPFLTKVLPFEFTAVLVKGRSNYLSLRRLDLAVSRSGQLLPEYDHVQELIQVRRWAQQSTEGSKSDLQSRPSPEVWDLVESDSNNCLGKQCPRFGGCFYFKARGRMADAHLLIVNHALFFSDLALRREGASLLPDYQAVIFDEAHTLEDVAADHLGLQISRGALEYLFNKTFNQRTGRGLLTLAPEGQRVAVQRQLDAARFAANGFFTALFDLHAGQSKSTWRVRRPGIVADTLTEELLKLGSALDEASKGLKQAEVTIEFRAAVNRCRALAGGIRNWLNQELEAQVYWLESLGGRTPSIRMASAPIDVGSTLKSLLFDAVPSVILTSATLSAGGEQGFEHLGKRLGLTRHRGLLLGSPFNYQEQAELHLFRKIPDPSLDPTAHEAAVRDKIKEYVLRTQGRTFVLFTSYQSLQRVASGLQEWFQDHGLRLLVQGGGLSRDQMVKEFKSGNAVLFGVDSFWQGVDIPGDALSCVIITKLPFAVPDRPVIEARIEAIRQSGQVPFLCYQVPQAVIKLKQGFGRLIRTKSDRGMIVLLDPRVLTKPYGRVFLDALPRCRVFVDGEAALERHDLG